MNYPRGICASGGEERSGQVSKEAIPAVQVRDHEIAVGGIK